MDQGISIKLLCILDSSNLEILKITFKENWPHNTENKSETDNTKTARDTNGILCTA